MPIHDIHLAQTYTGRGHAKTIGTSSKDAQIINGFVEVAVNPALGTKTVFLNKRSGYGVDAVSPASGVSNGPVLPVHYSNYFGTNTPLLATDSTLYQYSGGTATSLGTLTDNLVEATNYVFADAVIGSLGVLSWVTDDGAGWYLYSDAMDAPYPGRSGSITSGGATIVGLASTSNFYDGQLLSGSGIPAGTRVSDVLSSSAILMSQAATDSGTKTINREAIAKITDSDFPTDARNIAYMDGYFFASSESGKIYQSAINDPSSWSSSDVVACDYSGDDLSFIFRRGNHIVAAGAINTIQYFYNNGNSTGSVLSPASHLNITGLKLYCQPVEIGDAAYCVAKNVSNDSASASEVANPGSGGLYALRGVNSYAPVGGEMGGIAVIDRSFLRVGKLANGNKTLVACFDGAETTIPVYDPSTDFFTFFSTDSPIVSCNAKRFTKFDSDDIYIWQTVYQDNGSEFTLTVQTEPQDPAKGLSITDTWVDLLADIESTGTATISVSDDDYQNWTTKGTFDMTKNKKRVNALGFHDGPRAYRLQHSANTHFRGQILRLNFSPSRL